MNIAVVIPKPQFHNYLFPLGYGYLISLIKAFGFRPYVYDFNTSSFDEHIFLYSLKSKNIDAVLTGTAYKFHNNCPPFTINQMLKVVSLIKTEIPSIKTITVGPLISIYPNLFVKNKNFDYLVKGEPEAGLAGLLKFFSGDGGDIKKIRGIIYKDGESFVENDDACFLDLNTLDFPDREPFDMKNYIFNSYFSDRVTNILTSRGCPYSCTYCFGGSSASHAKANSGKYYRFVSPEKTIAEIKYLIDKYGIKGLRFEDIEFCIDKKRVVQLCQLLIKERLNSLRWRIVTRVTSLDFEILKLMREAGCVNIYYGVESGDNEILKATKKQITTQEVEEVFRLTRKAGIKADASFLIGVPGDNEKTIRNTVLFAKQIKPFAATFHVFAPYPGTELSQSKKLNDLAELDGFNVYEADENYSMCSISSRELRKKKQAAYRNFYMSFSFLFSFLKNCDRYFIKYIFSLMRNRGEAGWVRKLLFPSLSEVIKK